MRVLHVIPAIAHRYGGPSTAMRALASHLAVQPGIHIEIATTNANGAAEAIRPEDVDFDVPVHLFPRSFSERWKYSRTLGAWLGQHITEFDLVHIHALWSYAGTAAAATARRHGVPYIVRPAGMLSDYSLHHRAWLKRMYWCTVERKTVQGASVLHATTEGERDDLLKSCPNARVQVIPNGVEDAAWLPSESAARPAALGGAGEESLVLCLSRIHPVKGIVDTLLPAIRLLNSRTRLLLAGGADAHAPAYVDFVRSEIKRLGLEQRVQMLGDVAGHGRWELLDRADIFVLASHSENFGIVVAEAMARARPVVITNGVQISPHVKAAGAGLVVGPTPDDLAAALNRLLSDRDLCRSMGQAGQQYCREHFSWTVIARQVRAMYDSVLRDHHLPTTSSQPRALLHAQT